MKVISDTLSTIGYELHLSIHSSVSECSPIELQRRVRQNARKCPRHMYQYYHALVYNPKVFGE